MPADAAAIDALLEGLNPPQREAVTHGEGPLLILAGAGSGKTRVLTHRIAYLLRTGQARPSEILAITFTNKAANEMRERVELLVGRATRAMWVMTFHSACARMLRADAHRLGYTRQFTNHVQYRWLQLLTSEHRNLAVVGDDAQSIYGFRGADITNILNFTDDYPDAHVVKLEQNYRSTQTILDGANAVIAHNRGQMPKELWTDLGEGDP